MRDKILHNKVALRIFVENQEQAYNLRDFLICFLSPVNYLFWTKLGFPLYPSFGKNLNLANWFLFFFDFILIDIEK